MAENITLYELNNMLSIVVGNAFQVTKCDRETDAFPSYRVALLLEFGAQIIAQQAQIPHYGAFADPKSLGNDGNGVAVIVAANENCQISFGERAQKTV